MTEPLTEIAQKIYDQYVGFCSGVLGLGGDGMEIIIFWRAINHKLDRTAQPTISGKSQKYRLAFFWPKFNTV